MGTDKSKTNNGSSKHVRLKRLLGVPKKLWEWLLFEYYKWRGYEMVMLNGFERGDVVIISYNVGFRQKYSTRKRKILAKHESFVIINEKNKTTTNWYT